MFDRTFLPVAPGTDHMAPHLLAAAGFLANYLNDNTRQAYATDLRIYFDWCAGFKLDPLQARRMHVQAFAVHLGSERGNGPASVCRRIGTVGCYYDNAVVDRYIEHSPAHHLRLPKIHEDPAKLTWLSRWELDALMHCAIDSAQSADWAVIVLLAILGLRVSEACAVKIEDIRTDPAGYRLLKMVGKGGKPDLKVLPIPTWAAVDRAATNQLQTGPRIRKSGPLLLRRDGSPMNRRSAALIVERLARAAQITTEVTPHSLRRTHATLAIQSGVPIEVVQQSLGHASMRTTQHYNRLKVPLHAQAPNTIASLITASAA